MLSVLGLAMGMLQAQAQTEQPLVIKAGEAKELSLAENMNVVLIQAGATDTAFTINKTTSRELKVALSGDKLQIEGKNNLPKNTIVYVIVRDLKKLTVGYNTKVRTSGVLQATSLQVYVDGLASAHLRTTGKVKPFALGNFDVNVNIVEGPAGLIAKKSK